MPIYRLISFLVFFAFALSIAHWVNKPFVEAETAIPNCPDATSSLLGECESLAVPQSFESVIAHSVNRPNSNLEDVDGLFSLPVFNMYENPAGVANLFASPRFPDEVSTTKLKPNIFNDIYAVSSTELVGRNSFSGSYTQEEELNSVLTSSNNYELMSHLGGGSYAIAKQNDFVFLGIGPHVVILNVSDPNSPLLVGKTEYLPSYVTSIAVSGSYLYVGASGIHVFQITNLSQPNKVGFYSISATIWDITIQGQRAYIGGNYSGLLILNIANPHNPHFAGYYSGSLGQVYGIVVENNLAYLAAGSGLFIVNVANASNPYFVGYAHTPGTARGLSLAGNYAYVAAGYNSGLRIINIANSANPYEVGFINPEYSSAMGVIVQNNIAYVTEDWNGLRTIDVSNPANPIELGFYYVRRGIEDVVISGSHLFAAAEASGLHVLQVNDPEDPVLVGHYEEKPGIANAVTVHGHYAFVADDSAGIHTIDFSDFSAPVVVSTYATPGSARALAVEGNYLYLADYHSVIIFDISDPNNAIELGSVPASYATAIEVLNNIVYVADFNQGVRIIDASDPHHPVQIALWPTRANGLHVINNYVFVTTSWFSQGMHILDVSNPYEPFQVGFYDAMVSTSGVVVKDNHAFITNWENSLHVVNVVNVNNPSLVGVISVSGGGSDVDIVDNYLHVGTTQGLWTFDISQPATPQLVGNYNTPGWLLGIQAKDNFVFAADTWGGLHLLCFTGPGPNAYDCDYHFVDFYPQSASALTVTNRELSFWPRHLTLEATVQNYKTSGSVSDITISFYDGDPGAGGILIGTETIDELEAGQTHKAMVSWWLNGNIEDHQLYARLTWETVTRTISRPISVYYVDFQYDRDAYEFHNTEVGIITNNDILGFLADFDVPVILHQPLLPYIGGLMEINGHCYGISNSSILYFKYPYLKPIPDKTTYDHSVQEARAKIRTYQWLQLGPFFSAILRLEASDPSDQYDLTLQNIKQGNPVIHALMELDGFWPEPGAHAVVAYKVVDLGDEKRVFYYDNNFPLKNFWEGAPQYQSSQPYGIFDDSGFREPYYSQGTSPRYYNKAFVLQPQLSAPDNMRHLLMQLVRRIFDGLYIEGLLNVTIQGQVDLLAVDSFGRRVGYVGDEVFNEIPGATLTQIEGLQSLTLPVTEIYQFQITNPNNPVLSSTPNIASISILDPVTPSVSQLMVFQDVLIPGGATAFIQFTHGTTSPVLTLPNGDNQLPDINLPVDINDYIHESYLPVILR